MRSATTGTPTAHRNGFDFAQLDTSISQPTVGSAHTTYTGSRAARRSGDRYRSDDASTTVNRFSPCVLSTMQKMNSRASDATTARASVIAGATTIAVTAFDSTVIGSDTGSDFQNRMLR